MAGRYEDWAPYVPTSQEDCKLPQLYLMSVSYKRGFERRPYRDAGEAEERTEFVPKPHEDELVVCLRRGDNSHEETLTFSGLDAGKFMELIKPTEEKRLGVLIDKLRAAGRDEEADEQQFGVEGKDEYDGHRCRVCGKLAGGDRKHRCWA